MLLRSLLSAFSIALCCSSGFSQSWTAALLDRTDHDFGTIARGAKAEHAFLLQNPTSEEVHIARVRSSCGCAVARLQDGKRSIAPGESVTMVATINSAAFVGARSATITVVLDRPEAAELQLHLKAHVRCDVRIEPGRVELGPVASGQSAERSIQVSSSGRYSWGLVEVKCPHPHLRCEVAETGRDWNQVSYEVRVHLDGKASPGDLREYVVLVTNEPQQREIRVPVEGRVLPDVTVSPATLLLGVVQPGQEVSRQLVVRAKKPFRITGVKADGDGLDIDFHKTDAPQPFYLVPVTFRAGLQAGQVVHTIHIETDLEGGPLAVPASALVALPQPGDPAIAANAANGATAATVPSAYASPRSRPSASSLFPLGGRLPLFQRLLGGSNAASQSGGPAPAVPHTDPSSPRTTHLR